MTFSEQAHQRPFRLVQTEDGSVSTVDPLSGEHFHNPAGAWTEAQQHYGVPSGIGGDVSLGHSPRWIDACFGLGYGTWALMQRWLRSSPNPSPFHVVAFETQKGLEPHWNEVLRYLGEIDSDLVDVRLQLDPADSSPDSSCYSISQKGRLIGTVEMHWGDFRTGLQAQRAGVDFVLHDPFTPQRFPQHWTENIFHRYFQLLRLRSGRLMTYSTAAGVLGGMQQVGFQVYRTTALGFKRGGTLACTIPLGPLASEYAVSLPETDLTLLQIRSGIPYRDATFACNAREVLKRRNAEQRLSRLPIRA